MAITRNHTMIDECEIENNSIIQSHYFVSKRVKKRWGSLEMLDYILVTIKEKLIISDDVFNRIG